MANKWGYRGEMKRKTLRGITAGLATLFFLLVPFIITDAYYLHLIILSYIYVILVVSYDIHVGHLGLFSFMQAAFFGTGLYTSALCATKLKMSFSLALPLSGLVGGGVAFFFGALALTLSVFSFKITSIAFYMIIYLVVTNWVSLTGGPMGIKGIPSPSFQIPGFMNLTISSKADYYYLLLFFMVLILFVIYKLLNSRIGRAFHAIRDDESLAEAVGIHAWKYKMIGLVTSGIFAGIAGSLWAYYIRIAHPHAFGAEMFSGLLVMIIVGGLGSSAGVAVVAVALTFIPEFLRISGELRQIIYGLVLLGTILFMPEGVGGRVKLIMASLRRSSTSPS